jgi:hypothetical protein
MKGGVPDLGFLAPERDTERITVRDEENER